MTNDHPSKSSSSNEDPREFDVNSLSKVPDPIDIVEQANGCTSQVCVNNRAFGASEFCSNAVCASGIGECKSKT